MRGRPIGRTPAAAAKKASAPRSTGHASVYAACRWCGFEVMWLRHPDTGRLAPIDVDPVPDGNVIVHRDAGGRLLGTYGVVRKDEQALFDATKAVDLDARPTLHLNHWATCASPTARRLAKGRAARPAGEAPTAVDPKLEAPPEVIAARGCEVCGLAMDPALLRREPKNRTHPGCGRPTLDLEV